MRQNAPSKRIAALSLYPVLNYIEVKKYCIFFFLPKESICFLSTESLLMW